MRIGLYLGDLRRSQTNSHGIVNHAIGLANSLPKVLSEDEELFILASNEIREELLQATTHRVRLLEVSAPQRMLARLRMDHVDVLAWARRCGLNILHFPKGHVPLGRAPGVRVVATVHDDITVRYGRGDFGACAGRVKATYFSWATLHALRRADHIFTDSTFSAESLAGHVPSASARLTVVPSAMSLPILARVRRGEKRSVLVHLGSQLAHKRSAEAITWTREFLDAHDDYSLVVTGSLDPDVEELCRHPRIIRERRVLTNLEMARLVSEAVALVFPSTLEGFGLPPVEAACLGTPSVWARASALPEVMGDAPGGFLPGDRADFMNSLNKAVSLTDPELVRLQEQFVDRFSWDRIACGTLDVYRRLTTVAPLRATNTERLFVGASRAVNRIIDPPETALSGFRDAPKR